MKRYFYTFFVFFLLGMGIGFFLPHPPSRKATFIWWENLINETQAVDWYKNLQSEFYRHGYILETQDIHPTEDSTIVIWACPKIDLSGVSDTQYVVGWLMESPISLPQPLDEKTEQLFDLILTYRKDLVNYQKSFFVRIFTRISEINPQYWETPKSVLVSQIASYSTNGAYQERVEASKWFLENVPQDFKLYGNHWNNLKTRLSPTAQKALDKRYGGFIEDKFQAVSESKFVLAYENAIQSDYVTEKIYDVLQSGSVPVYLGAPNIDHYVPKNCFIDKNDFKTYKALYTFLKNMDNETYEKYRQCAYNFVLKKEIKQTEIGHRVARYIFQKKEKDFYDLYYHYKIGIADFFTTLF